METKIITLPDEKKVTLWEMNYGFRSDLQSAASAISMKGAEAKEMTVDVGNLQIMTLVYGIYESEDLGIVAPKDIDSGLLPEEVASRKKAVRRMSRHADILYHEINALNTEAEAEILKKSATPLTEK